MNELKEHGAAVDELSRLPKLARVCLERGADVGREDAEGLTSLHYALLGAGREVCRECADGAFLGMRRVWCVEGGWFGGLVG